MKKPMVEYCDRCRHLVPVAPHCPRCGFRMDGVPVPYHVGIRQVVRKERWQAEGRGPIQSIVDFRRWAAEIVRHWWAVDVHRAIQMLGQNWGIRIVWERK